MGKACSKDQDSSPRTSSRFSTSGQNENVRENGLSQWRSTSFGSKGRNDSANSCRTSIDSTSAGISRNKVLIAAYMGNPDAVLEFINSGFPIDHTLNESGWTLLHVAAQTGDLALLQLILDLGASIDVREESEDWTPLMVAALNGKLEAVKALIARGADPKLINKSNKRALDLALQYNCSNVYQYLKSFS
ncbi:unnamed protein product [Blepharisma stoltei]|uniref:Uncharacterized protein n=1 Tax=Blepharisma stoltei TaxID=1481888 RepID=A0AAU9IKX2_9CILI|nr:unnamed protein product [Blepharisma stoltei]